jgi:hypothetical protein
MRDAHAVGLRSPATIMYGHVEQARHWAAHLLAVRELQEETAGFTEFVPLPFVHMEAPLWRSGRARSGPSFREALLMHSVARLVLDPVLPSIQTSWVKMGREGALAALAAGANDLGGVLMNESITRAAGGVNGQEMDADAMQAAIRRCRSIETSSVNLAHRSCTDLSTIATDSTTLWNSLAMRAGSQSSGMSTASAGPISGTRLITAIRNLEMTLFFLAAKPPIGPWGGAAVDIDVTPDAVVERLGDVLEVVLAWRVQA